MLEIIDKGVVLEKLVKLLCSVSEIQSYFTAGSQDFKAAGNISFETFFVTDYFHETCYTIKTRF